MPGHCVSGPGVARPAAIRGATVEVVSGMDKFDGLLATARAAYARGDWHAAYRLLSQARELSELDAGDLSLLA